MRVKLGAGVAFAALALLPGCPAANPIEPDISSGSPQIDLFDQPRSLLATSNVPLILPPKPGARAVRGQILLNGKAGAGINIQLLRNGATVKTIRTDAKGYYYADGLADGSYQGYYYNASDRNKIGYWRSQPWTVNAKTGAAIPAVDLYQVGMTNTPKMDARVGLPTTFKWVRQAQPVERCYFRVHDKPFTSFTLVYRSGALAGDASAFTFTGAGLKLSPTNRYFWGYQWDAGAVGMGGNLYQAVYFNR
jgi:hypothetical protein